ncbi:MAG: type I-U CRISPR-associated protein Csb2 [Planctomycetota bacterium]
MSLAIEVRFVTGRYVATAYNDRAKAEWPPHPARLFSALVATWAESEESDPDERTTLVWLEAQGPPAIAASTADAREVVTVFVPVSNAAVTKDVVPMHDDFSRRKPGPAIAQQEHQGQRKGREAGRQVHCPPTRCDRQRGRSATKLTPGPCGTQSRRFPTARVRQPRTFPSVGPVDPVVTFVWSNADPTAPQRRALAELVTRVVRLGHSSSLVAIRLVDAAEVAPTWLPDDEGGEPLRVVRAGQLKALEQAHSLHREQEPRVLPFVIQRYATGQRGAKPSAIQSAFSNNWVPCFAG